MEALRLGCDRPKVHPVLSSAARTRLCPPFVYAMNFVPNMALLKARKLPSREPVMNDGTYTIVRHAPPTPSTHTSMSDIMHSNIGDASRLMIGNGSISWRSLTW